MAPTEQENFHRQLKIKTGVATRLDKEHKSYQNEEEAGKKKLDKLIAEDGEEWYIKNARNMLAETQKMIQDSAKRLGNATTDLREFIVRSEKDHATDEELVKAKETLEEISV